MAGASFKTLRETADLRHLRQIIVGLDEGVILINPDQSLLWANDAALAMHGVKEIADFGATVDQYRARFQLRYRNNHRVEADEYPIERVVAGDSFSEVVVEVTVAGEDGPRSPVAVPMVSRPKAGSSISSPRNARSAARKRRLR